LQETTFAERVVASMKVQSAGDDRRRLPQLPQATEPGRRKKRDRDPTFPSAPKQTLLSIISDGPGRRWRNNCGSLYSILRGERGTSAYGAVRCDPTAGSRRWKRRLRMMAPQTGDNVTDGRRDASHVFYPSDRHARGARCDRKRLLSHEPELVDDCCPGGGA